MRLHLSAITFFPAIAVSTFLAASAQEVLYPPGYNINSLYSLSSLNFGVADTLIISRTVINNEDFALHNLYFPENLPPAFTLVSFSILINGNAVPNFREGPNRSELISGYDCYRWLIDLPDSNSQFDRPLNSGDTLELEYRIISDSVGNFLLPFHTLCSYGNGSGFFTEAAEIEVTVFASPCNYIPGDPNSDGVANGLDIIFMVNYFKGGPVPAVRCYCPPANDLYAAGDVNGNCSFNGSDVIYMLNYLKGTGPAPRFCPSCPPN